MTHLLAQAAPAATAGVPAGLISGIVAAVTSGGVVAAAFRWLAHRDDRRESERATERREFLAALKSQADGCREELHGVVLAHREERHLDRDARHQIANRNASALAEVQQSVLRVETRLGTTPPASASGEHRAAT